MAKMIKASDARAHFSDVLNEVGVKGDRVILQRHGKGLVAIISIEDLELLERLEDGMDLQAAKKAKRGGRIGLNELKAKLGL